MPSLQNHLDFTRARVSNGASADRMALLHVDLVRKTIEVSFGIHKFEVME
jgi:hypothetical protein